MDRLSGEDWGRFKEKPRLVEFLFEGAGSCHRLVWYLDIAKSMRAAARAVDWSPSPIPDGMRGRPLGEDYEYLEKAVAKVIQRMDTDLRAMLRAQGISDEADIDDVCLLYARVVVRHEDDKTVEGILKALRQADRFDVPRSGTCG